MNDQKLHIELEKGAFILNKEKQADFKYSDLSDNEYKSINASVSFLKDAFASLLKFEKEPVNHPANLDEYLNVWGSSGFGKFMGIEAEQHAAFLAYNFGQYLVDKYEMKWQIKSDGFGVQTVVRVEKPVEIELYPIDSTLRAIKNKELAIYSDIEEKLKRTIAQLEN